jgi:hypothetical protein
MDSKNLIKKAYKYYDEQFLKYENIYNKISSFKLLDADSDMKKPKVKFYDNNNKLLFESNWEFMGNYYQNHNLWIWSWGIPNTKKNETYISKELLRYGCDINLENNNTNDKFLKMILTNSRFIIKNQISLDLLTHICLYLSKKEFVIYTPDDNNTLKYFYIYDIKIN